MQEFIQNPSVLNPTDEAFSKEKMEEVSNNNISITRVDSQGEVDNNDDWCEVEERPSGVTDTLLQDADRIISFAPGDGNKPLGISLDKDSIPFISFNILWKTKA